MTEDGIDLVHHVPAAEALDVGGGFGLLLEAGGHVALAMAEERAHMLVPRLCLGPGAKAGEDDVARRQRSIEGWILVEIGDLGASAAGDGASVGRLDAGQDTGERTLARAVDADQPDPLARTKGDG